MEKNRAEMLTIPNFVIDWVNPIQFAKINSLQQTGGHLVKKNQYLTKENQYPVRTPFVGSCLHLSCNMYFFIFFLY